MFEYKRKSESEFSSETRNSSSQSSMSSESCSSFSRLSFELPTSRSSPENLSLKPHRSSDFAYSAIRSATFASKTGLTFRDFRLLRRIGSGDIGTVYLCRLANADEKCYYAMKVVDKEALEMKKKVQRAEMEKKILKMLDHPFLPTLYAEFEASHFSCIVMEYCSGGDLHSLRHKQPQKRFSLSSARLFRSKKIQTLTPSKLFFVAEPVAARSRSFVGTHEYVSPEVASGGSHGNAVDWWALGIFIYEMIYGRTPFAAPSNELTLRNIVKRPLTFPIHPPSSLSEHHARDLISGLLNKDPNSRLGSKRGAADVKTHPFFKGLNFALIRSLTPPEIPGLRRQSTTTTSCYHPKSEERSTAFDYF
ncbi:Protein kinase domain - like 10 [Theobroma cacao]|nr:Protein kinase domain - like 10 [Theobroma cacao]